MTHEQDNTHNIDTGERALLGLRNRRVRRALAALLIGGGVVAGGAITLDRVLDNSSHQTDDRHYMMEVGDQQPSDDVFVIDCWPDAPKNG